MPGKPDLPCADCGKLMWRGKGVLPEGQARCRECRGVGSGRIPHGTATGYKLRCRCAGCREAKRLEMRRYVATVKARDGVSPTQKYRPAVVKRPPGACSECGKALIQAGPVEPMCSPCRKRQNRGLDIKPADRLAIYQRDCWVCGFCGGAVDPSLKSPDPWAPSLDHIIPRSKGGPDDETNLRIVHRYCNGVRGNRDALTLDELAG